MYLQENRNWPYLFQRHFVEVIDILNCIPFKPAMIPILWKDTHTCTKIYAKDVHYINL